MQLLGRRKGRSELVRKHTANEIPSEFPKFSGKPASHLEDLPLIPIRNIMILDTHDLPVCEQPLVLVGQ